MPDFRNPYNFIPLAPRPTTGPLQDGRPAGHRRYVDDRWSGTIDVELRTETPLLIPDAGMAKEAPAGHKVFLTRIGPDGLPYLPPTSIKGMLRAAYEAVTNSRMGILEDHAGRLAFRMKAQEGLGLVPAQITAAGIELLPGYVTGLTDPLPRGAWPNGSVQVAFGAWLRRYPEEKAMHYWDTQGLPQTGEPAWAWLELFQHYKENDLSADFRFWRVREIATTRTGLSASAPTPTPVSQVAHHSRHQPVGVALVRVLGRVLVTNQNINKKHDERLFFCEIDPALKTSACSDYLVPWAGARDGHERQWRDVITSYRAAHRDSEIWRTERVGNHTSEIDPHAFKGPTPGKTAWSPHLYEDGRPHRGRVWGPDAADLADGTVCYARIDGARGAYRVKALYPVAIARELFTSPPIDLIPEPMRQAPAIDKLSPADRVFGWVRPRGAARADGTTDAGVNAYRGHVRITAPVCQATTVRDALDDFGGTPLVLPILSKPKPQQARFYLADAAGAPLNPQNNAAAFKESAEQKIRGRKVYPHHRVADATRYWDPSQRNDGLAREYLQPPNDKGKPDQSEQNRSIASWVRPGVPFRFSIQITNLSDAELGALLWLLQLEEGHFHRLGGGKPFGFGSVRLSIRAVDLRNGLAEREHYRRLVPPDTTEARGVAAEEDGPKWATTPDSPHLTRCVTEFETAVASSCGVATCVDAPYIKAFLRACAGFPDELPTHYPRVSPTPDAKGENFKWFQKNENGPRQSLGRPVDDPGLPYFE